MFANTYKSSFAVLIFVLALAVTLLLLMYNAPGLHDVRTDISHGVEKHGSDALQTRKCLDENGPMLTMRNLITGRWAEVCQLPDGRFGVRISEQIDGLFQEITAFAGDNWDEIWEVERYLWNQGYGTP